MRFDEQITIVNGAVTADPIATPANVPDSHIVRFRRRDPDVEAPNARFVLGLNAPVAETVDIELYVLDSSDDEAAAVDRRWYLVATIAGLAGRTLSETATAIVGGGLLYVRVTAETITVNRVLHIRASS